ncbi:hypothetical protein D9M68_101780 [compost metagenome]
MDPWIELDEDAQTRRIIKLPPALETLDCSEADAIAEGLERRPSADGDWAHYLDTGLSTDARGGYGEVDQRPRLMDRQAVGVVGGVQEVQT